MRRRFGILGYPLRHSLSPVFWGRYFAERHPRFRYEALEVPPGHPLPDLSTFRGLNVTSPWKARVLGFVDEMDPVVRRIRAANVLVYDARRERWRAHNTDVEGFLLGLRGLSVVPGKALILGTGGAARAAAVALERAGFRDILLVSRNPERPEIPWPVVGYGDLEDAWIWEGLDLLVQATPLSWEGKLPPVPWERVPHGVAGYEMAYGRWTPFLEVMQTRGPVMDGTLMLLGQALEAGRIWLGSRFDARRFEEIFHAVVPLLPRRG